MVSCRETQARKVPQRGHTQPWDTPTQHPCDRESAAESAAESGGGSAHGSFQMKPDEIIRMKKLSWVRWNRWGPAQSQGLLTLTSPPWSTHSACHRLPSLPPHSAHRGLLGYGASSTPDAAQLPVNADWEADAGTDFLTRRAGNSHSLTLMSFILGRDMIFHFVSFFPSPFPFFSLFFSIRFTNQWGLYV